MDPRGHQVAGAIRLWGHSNFAIDVGERPHVLRDEHLARDFEHGAKDAPVHDIARSHLAFDHVLALDREVHHLSPRHP